MTLTETLAALYASEINCRIESDWTGGWRVAVGDIRNGFVPFSDGLKLSEVPAVLTSQAMSRYPGSDFAKARAA